MRSVMYRFPLIKGSSRLPSQVRRRPLAYVRTIVTGCWTLSRRADDPISHLHGVVDARLPRSKPTWAEAKVDGRIRQRS